MNTLCFLFDVSTCWSEDIDVKPCFSYLFLRGLMSSEDEHQLCVTIKKGEFVVPWGTSLSFDVDFTFETHD